MLSFASYANLLIAATKENSQFIVNELMGCVVKPLELMDKDGLPFHVDKGATSRYLKGERSIHQKIIQGTKDKKVLDGATDYFERNIVALINPAMKADLISNLIKAISVDSTISESKKSELLSLANEGNLADFLSSIFLYVANKPNVAPDKSKEHKNVFISYASVDSSWARWIADVLERAGLTVFSGEWDLHPGDDFITKINKAICAFPHFKDNKFD